MMMAIRVTMTLFLLQCLYMMVTASSTYGCSHCPVKHHQQHYCDSDLVIRGKVMGNSYIKVQGVYKGKELLMRSGRKLQFSNSAPQDCWKSNLQFGTTYLLMGRFYDNTLHIGQCDWVELWDSLTSAQRQGLRTDYKLGCKQCTIDEATSIIRPYIDLFSFYDDSFNIPNAAEAYWRTEDCFYNPLASRMYSSEDCETKYSFCTAQADGRCTWTETPQYNRCFQERQDNQCLNDAFALPTWRCPEDCETVQEGCMRDMCIRDTEGITCHRQNGNSLS